MNGHVDRQTDGSRLMGEEKLGGRKGQKVEEEKEECLYGHKTVLALFGFSL